MRLNRRRVDVAFDDEAVVGFDFILDPFVHLTDIISVELNSLIFRDDVNRRLAKHRAARMGRDGIVLLPLYVAERDRFVLVGETLRADALNRDRTFGSFGVLIGGDGAPERGEVAREAFFANRQVDVRIVLPRLNADDPVFVCTERG